MNQAYSVTEINQYIKNKFIRDGFLNRIYIKGEVSNCTYHGSGHIYFNMKDRGGQLSCVMFAGQRKGLTFTLEEGQSVIVLGSIGVYERSGRYQLYASEILLDGQGVLYEQFEKLKVNLEKEGLFDSEHKKPVPAYPQKVGIVTASTGAAIQDMVNITNRRNPYVQLILYPALVQGDGAAASIVKGIKTLDQMNLDTIIIGRGGGSIEDLWAFNEEIVARAIYSSKTPIVSAVGHETDVTIADHVADLRAPTPSAAAELVINDYMIYLKDMETLTAKLRNIMTYKITSYKSNLNEYKLRLSYGSPAYQMKEKRQELVDIEQRMHNNIKQKIKLKRHRLEVLITKMEGLSPVSKLSKGYAMVVGEEKKPIKSVEDVQSNELLTISLLDGNINAKVQAVERISRKDNL